MSSPLQPDPYVALGVAKDATSAQIKTIYRKLVLKCHPDKVTDESLKAKAADDFHRIQQAYEIIGDDEKRSRYDAQVKLVELRKEVMQKQRSAAPRADVRTAAYEVPTTSPGRTAYTARGPERTYEIRKPSSVYEAEREYFPETRASSRKHDDYDRTPKRPSPKDDRERVKSYERSEKETDKYAKSEKRRTRDKEIRRDREDKHSYVDDDSDSDDAPRQSRHEDARRREPGRDRERGDRERTRESDRYTSQSRKHSDPVIEKLGHVLSYIEGSRARPAAPSRTSSSRDAYDVQRPKDGGRPVMLRRPSARPRSSARDASPPASSRRDKERERKYSVPDVMEIPESRERRDGRDPRIPSLQSSSSSPAAIRVPRAPMRSQSLQVDTDYQSSTQPRQMYRSETMPNVSPRKDSSAPSKSSNLRHTEINGGLPTPSTTPEYVSPVPSYQTHRYRYSPTERDLDDLDGVGGRRTVVREPLERERDRPRVTRSPSPIRQTRPGNSRHPTAPQPPPIRTTLPPQSYYGPSPTESPQSYRRPSPIHREGSERPLYGETSKGGAPARTYEYSERDRERPREAPRQRYASNVENIPYSSKFGPEVLSSQAPYDRRGDRPSMRRAETLSY